MNTSVQFDEKRIDKIFVDVSQSHLPGCAAGIAINGKTVYRKGFGLASLELPVALSPTIRMRIGSVSKQFAALGCLMLCEEGRCSVDDPVGSHIPELHPKVRGVTLRQLMGNNSGLRDVNDIVKQFNGAERGRVTAADLLPFYCNHSELNAPPGTAHIYNNGGWLLLGIAMERISGESLEQVLWKRVFEPIGMYDTLVRRWDAECTSNSSTAHAVGNDGKYEKAETGGGVDFGAAGAIASTVDDMLRWLAHMSNPAIGSQQTWALMKTAQRLSNGTSTQYGCGLSNQRVRGVQMIWHGGGGYGSNAQMIKIPDAELDVIVICNRSDKSSPAYAEKILEACLPALEPELVPETYAGPFPVGVFRSKRTGRVVQMGYSDTLYYRGGTEVPVAAIDGHIFPFAPDRHGVLRPCSEVFGDFSIRPVGPLEQPTSLELTDYGTTDELALVPSRLGPDIAVVTGQFYSEETETEATISATERGPQVKMRGQFGSAVHTLEYLADGVWRTRLINRWISPRWGFLVFDGGANEFGFYTYLTRNLRFRRRIVSGGVDPRYFGGAMRF